MENITTDTQPQDATQATTQPDSQQQPFSDAQARLQQLKAEIQKVIVGQDAVIDDILICMLAAGHALVEGVPGLGKTLLVRSLSQALAGRFNRIQFTPDLMPTDIAGHAMFNREQDDFVIRKGPVFCHFLLADEINRAPAKTQSALLEAMQEQQVTIEGQSLSLPTPFMVMATQNPLEHEGTYPLPEAQLDRFLMHIWIDYPDEKQEIELSKRMAANKGDQLNTQTINELMTPDDISALQTLLTRMEVDDSIHDYAVRLVRATRDWHGIEVGAGPRGSLALLRTARARALTQGRYFVIPDDVKAMAVAVLRHRIRLSAELEIEGISPSQVIAELVQSVEAPRV
ncbi:AAA family ATPase [Bacterioplanoides pacificum]|uniref:AAA family ATPase n=1 Tax=Bacterioplanoides pacificum TaxID=1171596 RepID=A0ABV7VWU3_9GAMM